MRYVIADSSLFNIQGDNPQKNLRGLNVWTLSELRGVTGQTKRGEFITGTIQAPMFNLAPEERVAIMQSSAYVQAVIGSRMNRISSLDWTVVPRKEKQEEIYNEIKTLKQIFDEYDNPNDLRHLMLKFQIRKKLKENMPDLLDDLANFKTAFIRFKKKIDMEKSLKCQEIIDWLSEPNMEDEYDDWIKKYVESLMIHGSTSVYKEWNDRKLDNFYVLPGGTVYPLRSVNVGTYLAYAQIVVGHLPKIYFQDEICFTNYLPSACRSYGYVPLDALINKIAEQLLFDQLAAERADGTKEPEKLIIFGDTRSPFGDLTGDVVNLPMDTDEQKRVEEKLNLARKGAIATLSGIGTPAVMDISKADTFAAQSTRQDKVLRDIALVFNMTNMEINLAGGEFTSGKETSITQQEIEEGKGTRPIIKKLETIFTKHIIPYRFGSGYIHQYKKGFTDMEQIDLDTRRAQSGTWTKNEIREDRGDDPMIEEGNDTLQQQEAPQPGTETNPMVTRQIK